MRCRRTYVLNNLCIQHCRYLVLRPSQLFTNKMQFSKAYYFPIYRHDNSKAAIILTFALHKPELQFLYQMSFLLGQSSLERLLLLCQTGIYRGNNGKPAILLTFALHIYLFVIISVVRRFNVPYRYLPPKKAIQPP